MCKKIFYIIMSYLIAIGGLGVIAGVVILLEYLITTYPNVMKPLINLSLCGFLLTLIAISIYAIFFSDKSGE